MGGCTPSSPVPRRPTSRHTASRAGLHFDCDTPARPGFRVELAVGRRIRVVSGAQVLLHARPGLLHWVTLLRAAEAAPSPWPHLGPRDVAAVSRNADPVDAPTWLDAWARYIVRQLDAPALRLAGPLHRGTWRVEPAALVRPDAGPPPPGHRAAFAPDYDAVGFGLDAVSPLNFETWWLNGSGALLPMRAASAADAGRVKALRKLARAGTLPPLVLLFVSGLDMYLWSMATTACAPPCSRSSLPPALALSRVRYFPYAPDPRREAALAGMERARTTLRAPTIERLNRSVLALFAEGDWRAARAVGPCRAAPAWDAEALADCLRTLGLTDAPEAAGLVGSTLKGSGAPGPRVPASTMTRPPPGGGCVRTTATRSGQASARSTVYSPAPKRVFGSATSHAPPSAAVCVHSTDTVRPAARFAGLSNSSGTRSRRGRPVCRRRRAAAARDSIGPRSGRVCRERAPGGGRSRRRRC